jgi:integrase
MTAYITKRNSKSGPRWIVRFRFGGRVSPLIHCGSFKTLKDARSRLEFVTAELAYGRDPRVTLDKINDPPPLAPTMDEWFDRCIQARLDITAKTEKSYRQAQARLGDLAAADPFVLQPADFRQWIARQLEGPDGLSPASVAHYFSKIRQVIDFAEVDPNPARSKLITLPTVEEEEINPPSGAEWLRIRDHLDDDVSLLLRLCECDALRIDEALSVQWGDFDFAEGRMRIAKSRTKRRTAGQRWLWVPDGLLEEIEARKPIEDRDLQQAVFAGLTDGTVRYRMERACKLAGVPHYHPHDLRHRRISLWVRMGIDPIAAKIWAGHTKASMTLDRYAHVLVDNADEWREFWADRYQEERRERRGMEA